MYIKINLLNMLSITYKFGLFDIIIKNCPNYRLYNIIYKEKYFGLMPAYLLILVYIYTADSCQFFWCWSFIRLRHSVQKKARFGPQEIYQCHICIGNENLSQDEIYNIIVHTHILYIDMYIIIREVILIIRPTVIWWSLLNGML